jgi:hypothetical protein
MIFQLQQMRVARNHEIGFGGNGAPEHRVVVRIVGAVGWPRAPRAPAPGYAGPTISPCWASE